MTQQKSKIEIINETAAFYNLGNRGYNEDEGCIYSNADKTKMCAVGRCMNDPLEYPSHEIEFILKLNGDDKTVFKPEYQGHDIGFWSTLQFFHDNANNWTETGLSEQGKIKLQELRTKYRG